jgi:predicted nucleotidyltransferase
MPEVPTEAEQMDRVLTAVRDLLGEDLVGAYLHGSATLGGLRPRSDVDVLVVSRRRLSRDERAGLTARMIEVTGHPRPVELTVVVQDEIRPWRYPPRMELQFGDWLRPALDRGEEPWPEVNPDLAPLVRMAVEADRALLGPPARDVFDPVPRADFVEALAHGVAELLQDLDSDTRNVILTLARVWSGIETDRVMSKDAAADWALPRLPETLRPVLDRARRIYVTGDEDRWDDVRPLVHAYAQRMAAQIDRARAAAVAAALPPR